MSADPGPGPAGRDIELGTQLGDELSQARIDDLSADTRSPSDKSVDQLIGAENVRALQHAHGYRRALVRWTLVVVAYLALASTIFMGGYIWFERGHIEASVMISFFVSVVTETIGVLYVIARYLFPSPNNKSD